MIQPASVSRRPVAVIDIGSSAIRMEIAEIDAVGGVHSLETLQHPLSLGKDTFASGRIDVATVEECVSILRGFRRVLRDYGIERDDQIRAVATSSVREAANRDAFLNRIYIASHTRVEVVDEMEVNRLAYMAVRDSLTKQAVQEQGDTLVVEVGGGSSEVLLVQGGHVTLSRTYRLGSLRMRETLETYKTPPQRIGAILTRHIQRTIAQIQRSIPKDPVQTMIAIGGDARFAAHELAPEKDAEQLVEISLLRFSRFAKKMVSLSIDELVRVYRMTYQEAETVGPALLAYARLAESFGIHRLLIARSTLRDGLLLEMAAGGTGSEPFRDQVLHSAMMLGRKYGYEERHAVHVAEIARRLFTLLQSDHELEPRHELMLRCAALLHEIGLYVGNQSHHKHSMYLIQNSDLFGLSRTDKELVALVARYHRRATPQQSHVEYMALARDQRLEVSKLAAILRVADALDQNHMQQVRKFTVQREPGRLVLLVRGLEDLTLERVALRQKGPMFEEVYGMKVELRRNASRRGGSLDG